MVADSQYDIEGPLIYSKITHDIVGVHHSGSENGTIFFDKSYNDFQDKLNKSLPDSFNSVVSYSSDERKYILFNSSSTSPGAYFVGDKDRIVSVDQSRKMASELKSYDKDVTYIEFENGNHHLEIEAHRLATLRAIEEFLRKHIGADLPVTAK